MIPPLESMSKPEDDLLRNAKVFITGGAGFIGSHFAYELSKLANEVKVYDKLVHHNTQAEQKPNENVELIRGDMVDFEKLNEEIEGSDFVFHLAANSNIALSAQEPDLDYVNGQVSTYNLLKAMKNKGIRKLVYFSGSGVYGDKSTLFDEAWGPLLPVSPYGASKLGSEAWISAFSHISGISSWIFRPANIVGEGQTHGVAYDFVRKLRNNPHELEIHGNGLQTKSYVYIDDVVSGVVRAVASVQPHPVEVFNIASEDTITVNEIADITAGIMGLQDVRYLYSGGSIGWKGDVSTIKLSIDKLKRTGWLPSKTSKMAIELAVRWLAANLK